MSIQQICQNVYLKIILCISFCLYYFIFLIRNEHSTNMSKYIRKNYFTFETKYNDVVRKKIFFSLDDFQYVHIIHIYTQEWTYEEAREKWRNGGSRVELNFSFFFFFPIFLFSFFFHENVFSEILTKPLQKRRRQRVKERGGGGSGGGERVFLAR